jgi:hypothetical protein
VIGFQLGRSENIHERQVGVHADRDTAFSRNPKSSRRFGRNK